MFELCEMQIHIARLGVYLCLEDSMRGVTHFDHLIKLYLYLWLYIFRCFKEHGISSTNISIKYVRLADSASAQRRGCQEGCCTGTEWFDHPGLSLASAGECRALIGFLYPTTCTDTAPVSALDTITRLWLADNITSSLPIGSDQAPREMGAVI